MTWTTESRQLEEAELDDQRVAGVVAVLSDLLAGVMLGELVPPTSARAATSCRWCAQPLTGLQTAYCSPACCRRWANAIGRYRRGRDRCLRPIAIHRRNLADEPGAGRFIASAA